jgi:hypothetical protein
MSIKIDPTCTTTTTPAKPRPKPKRRRRADVEHCPKCGDELAVRWRGRAWCVRCDATALFGGTEGADS